MSLKIGKKSNRICILILFLLNLINHDTVRKPVRVVRGLLISKSYLGYVSSYVNTEVFVANKPPTPTLYFFGQTFYRQTNNTRFYSI